MRILILFSFLLNSAFALEGRVHTSEGMGVESANVILKINNQEYKALTGERGTFYFFDVGANTDYELVVKKSGHSTNNIFGNTSESQNVSIELNPKIFTLSGKVMTKTGEAISNTEVSLEGAGTKFTSEAGIFSFDLPYGTKYKITLKKGENEYFFYNSPEGVIYGNTERMIVGEFE